MPRAVAVAPEVPGIAEAWSIAAVLAVSFSEFESYVLGLLPGQERGEISRRFQGANGSVEEHIYMSYDLEGPDVKSEGLTLSKLCTCWILGGSHREVII